MPKVHREETKEQLGDLFQNAFLSRDTRSYDSVSTDMLGVWLKLMGGDPPGSLTLAPNVPPIDYSSPDQAWRVPGFYDTREKPFRYNEMIWPIQSEYFK